MGGTPPRGSSKFWDEKKATSNVWLSIADMPKTLHARISESTEHLSEEGAKRVKVVKAGTLLVSFKLTLGRLAYADIDLRTNEAIAALELFDETLLSKKYLYWYLTFFDWRKAAEGGDKVKGKTLNKAKLAVLPVLVPSLAEQQRIVAILDEAFAGLATATANAEKNLKNAREVFDGYLNSVFAQEGGRWREVSLGKVCAISSKLVDPREARFSDLLHLGAGNMASKTGELSDIKTAREEGLKSGKFLFDKTMVLYSKIRPYLMKACRPDFEGLCSADVYPLSPDPTQLERNFFFHLLMSKDFTDFAIAGSDRAGMPKVNRDHLFKYRVKLPNIEEQVRLAAKLDAISAEANRLEAFYERRLADIAELKQSILQQAFSGELTSPPSQAIKEAAE